MKDQPRTRISREERHSWQLWVGALALIIVLAGTVHLLNLHLVKLMREAGLTTGWLVDGYYTGVALTGLAIVFVLYTVFKQSQLLRVRRLLDSEEDELEHVRTRLSEVSSLFEVATALNLQLSLESVLDIIVRRVISALHAQQASIMIYNPQLKMLETRAHYGLGSELVAGGRQKLGEGIAGKVAEHQQGVVLDDTTTSDDLKRHYRRSRNITSALSVPLKVDDRCVGVLNVSRINHPTPFNDNQREVLQIFAEHVGSALARAETLEELGQRAHDLELANAKLTEVNRLKDVFLSTASHELKTPLTTVIAYAELLKEHDEGLPAEQRRDFVGRLRGEAERLLTLIDDILDLTRLETGKLRLNYRNAALADVVTDAVETTEHLAHKHGVEVTTQLEDDSDLLAMDDVKIRQVVVNLLTNAIRWSPDGGQIKVRVFNESQACVLEVIDEGPGVPPDEVSQIFGLFGQGLRGEGRQKEGLGIGLHLVKRIVEMHGGTVGVQPRRPRGSVFWVRLPRSGQRDSLIAA